MNFPLKILVVEDDWTTQELLSIYLAKYGAVVAVDNGNEAIIECHSIVFDLILMDIKSNNGMDGVQTLKLIREIEKYKTTPILAVTGCVMSGDKERLLNEGFDGYLPKPFLKITFIEFIKKYLPLTQPIH